MEFLCDSGPLRQPLLKSQIHPPGQLMHVEAVERRDAACTRQDDAGTKPPGFSERRIDLERDRPFVAVPGAVRVACDHPKAIRARGQVHVNSLPGSHWLAPG